MGGDKVTSGERGVMEDHSEEVAFVGRPREGRPPPTGEGQNDTGPHAPS